VPDRVHVKLHAQLGADLDGFTVQICGPPARLRSFDHLLLERNHLAIRGALRRGRLTDDRHASEVGIIALKESDQIQPHDGAGAHRGLVRHGMRDQRSLRTGGEADEGDPIRAPGLQVANHALDDRAFRLSRLDREVRIPHALFPDSGDL